MAVTHVQGSPKGGGALGPPGVPNTRLAPVPPEKWGASMWRRASAYLSVFGLGVIVPAQAQAQNGAAREAIQTMARNPDGFCRLTVHASNSLSTGVQVSSINEGVANLYNDSELLAEATRLASASTTTAARLTDASGGPTGYQKLLEQVRNDSSIQDRAEAERRHRAEVLGQAYAPPQNAPNVALNNTKATTFDQRSTTLFCQSEALVDEALWVVVTWQVGFGRRAADTYHGGDGWYVRQVESPDPTIESAGIHPDKVKVSFGDRLRLPLAEARTKVHADAVDLARRQAAERAEQERRTAYANSPAGRAEAAAYAAQQAENMRALAAEYRRRGLACQNSGGTWGIRGDANIILEVPPGAVPNDIARFTLGCYRL